MTGVWRRLGYRLMLTGVQPLVRVGFWLATHNPVKS